MAQGFNPVPATIRIQRMLGATRPIRPMRPIMPVKPTALPHLGGANMMHNLMRPFGRAQGGIIDSPSTPFTGAIMSPNAGRADDIQAHVPNGSYVFPAWFISHLGEGNTMNGMARLKMMFGQPWQGPSTPMGAPSPKLPTHSTMGPPKPPPAGWGMQQHMIIPGMSAKNPALAQSAGGKATDGGGPVPVNLSGGEFVVQPEMVAHVGDGDVNKGHRVLDRWVIEEKKAAVNTLKKLPGPAQS